jgi:hypothetical protein
VFAVGKKLGELNPTTRKDLCLLVLGYRGNGKPMSNFTTLLAILAVVLVLLRELLLALQETPLLWIVSGALLRLLLESVDVPTFMLM